MQRISEGLLVVLLMLPLVMVAARCGMAAELNADRADPASETLVPAGEKPGWHEATGQEAGSGNGAGTKLDAAPSDEGSFLAYEEAAPHPRRSFASLMLRLLLSMAAILGVIYGGLMLVRLLARKTKAAPKSEKLIRVVDRAALDPKRAIFLVKVCDRLLVVGVGTNEIRTLAQIEDETIVENVSETEFTGHLQSLLGRLAGRAG